MTFVATKNGTKKFPPPLLVLLLDPGSGMDKNRIWDKHPVSATLRLQWKYNVDLSSSLFDSLYLIHRVHTE